METLSLINFVSAKLAKLNIKLPKHFSVITTCNQNPLHNWATRHGLDVTDFPKDVGGRFSVLTSVGLIPAVFAGINIDEMQAGARWTLSQPDLIKRLTSLTLESFVQEKWITVFWAYPDALSLMGDWVRQLWAESIAKAEDRKGNKGPRVSTPFLCQGTKDQHSVLQQLGEGYKDKFIWFLKSKNTETHVSTPVTNHFPEAAFLNHANLNSLIKVEAQATQDALIANKVPTLTLVSDSTGAKEIGAYFMLFQMVIGVLGEALDINAFDQPGVELGKKLAIKTLT